MQVEMEDGEASWLVEHEPGALAAASCSNSMAA